MEILLEESVSRIKQVVNWFPGVLLGLKRQTGKTQAILEMVRERHDGEAVVVVINETIGRLMKARYSMMYGRDARQPVFVADLRFLPPSLPIYVDEWWYVEKDFREGLLRSGRVVCRLGTDFEAR